MAFGVRESLNRCGSPFSLPSRKVGVEPIVGDAAGGGMCVAVAGIRPFGRELHASSTTFPLLRRASM